MEGDLIITRFVMDPDGMVNSDVTNGLRLLVEECVYGEYLNNRDINRSNALSLKYNEILKFVKNNPKTCFCIKQNSEVKGFIGFQNLDWDSNHFCFKVAMVNHILVRGNGSQQKFLIQSKLLNFFNSWCEKENIRLSYVRSSNENINLIHTLESQGYKYVENRLQVYLDINKFEKKSVFNSDMEYVELSPEYENQALAITKNALTISRFHKDPLTKGKADDVYKKWVINSLRNSSKKKVILKLNGKFAGFFIYYLKKIPEFGLTSLWLDLAIISPEFKGKGLGYPFYEYIINQEKEKVDFVEWKFSLSNVPVFKIATKMRADIVFSELTFHKAFKTNNSI